jgi:hypothetical protein
VTRQGRVLETEPPASKSVQPRPSCRPPSICSDRSRSARQTESVWPVYRQPVRLSLYRWRNEDCNPFSTCMDTGEVDRRFLGYSWPSTSSAADHVRIWPAALQGRGRAECLRPPTEEEPLERALGAFAFAAAILDLPFPGLWQLFAPVAASVMAAIILRGAEPSGQVLRAMAIFYVSAPACPTFVERGLLIESGSSAAKNDKVIANEPDNRSAQDLFLVAGTRERRLRRRHMPDDLGEMARSPGRSATASARTHCTMVGTTGLLRAEK